MANENSGTRKPGFVSTQQVPITNPQGLKAVYANHFGVSATMTDLTLYFLEVGQTPNGTGATQHQEVKAIITIPLAMGTAMAPVLQQATAQAQKNFETAIKQLSELKDSAKK